MTIEIFIFILALVAILVFTFKPIKIKKKKEEVKDEKCDGCSEDSCDTCPLLSDFQNFKDDFYRDSSYEREDKVDEKKRLH